MVWVLSRLSILLNSSVTVTNTETSGKKWTKHLFIWKCVSSTSGVFKLFIMYFLIDVLVSTLVSDLYYQLKNMKFHCKILLIFAKNITNKMSDYTKSVINYFSIYVNLYTSVLNKLWPLLCIIFIMTNNIALLKIFKG